MKPLILDFAEEPRKVDIDYSHIEYSEQLNLTIFKDTGEPAICEFALDTSTFNEGEGLPADRDPDTRSINNGKKKDIDDLRILFETRTVTHVQRETSDSD